MAPDESLGDSVLGARVFAVVEGVLAELGDARTSGSTVRVLALRPQISRTPSLGSPTLRGAWS
jgi:hypothetical protein